MSVLRSGLVSITFRQLPAREVVRLAREAGLEGIEWGGDVHVPHGDLPAARDVRALTEDAGLTIPSYGSYYRVGHDDVPFAAVLDSAVALGAPLIRVWAGKRGAAEADGPYRGVVIEDSRRIADLAAEAGVAVAYEFHGGTLTDTNASAGNLLVQVAHNSVLSCWQPPQGMPEDECLRGLGIVLPKLAHLHVFSWADDGTRLPLARREDRWRKYLRAATEGVSEGRTPPGREHYAMIEFVAGDEPRQLLEDASTLKRWLAELG